MKIIIKKSKSLLKERKSDILYQEIILFYQEKILSNINRYYDVVPYTDQEFLNLFKNELLSPVWAKKKKDRVEIKGRISNTWNQNVLFGLLPNNLEIKDSYYFFRQFQSNFRKKNNVGADINEIINNEDDFYRFFSPIKIVFFNNEERPDAGADMANNGLMRVFINLSQKDSIDHKAEAKKWFDNSKNRKVIAHELAHYINSFRSGYKTIRTSGSGKNTLKQFSPSIDSGHWYANSTEEMQARITDLTNDLIKKIENGDREIIDMVSQNDFSSFKKELLKKDSSLFYYQSKGKSDVMSSLPPLPPIPQNTTPIKVDGLPPLPSLPKKIKTKELTPAKKNEIRRKLDNRLFDLYNLLKNKIKSDKLDV